MPFKNLSNNSDYEYFSDGLTEEIINALTKVKGLKVTARTSSFAFKNINVNIKEIGRKLNVSLLLEGSIRIASNRIRISAQLIRVSDGFNIWSETFDRELIEVFELQDEISLLIADKIRENYGHLEIAKNLFRSSTRDIKAYQYYLKGKELYNNWDLLGFQRAAIEYEKSIVADPSFDLPYFGAGLSYSFLGSWGTMDKTEAFNKVNSLFSIGISLDVVSNFKHYSIAKHLFWGLWDFKKAYNELNKAYQLLPQDASINEFMSEINALAGNFIVATKHIDTSIQTNPLSPTHYYTKGQILFLQSQFSRAIDVLQIGIRIDSAFSISKELLMACLILHGDEILFNKSLDNFDQISNKFYRGIFRLVNHQEKFEEYLLKDLYKGESSPLLAWDLYILVHQNKIKEALLLLKDKVENQMGNALYFRYDPFLKPLHGNESFRDLVTKYSLESNIIKNIPKKSKTTHLDEEETKHYSNSLLTLMENEKPYLNSKLGLKDLAVKLNLHPNKLSWLLNESFDKNFYNFINEYRIKEFQKKAIDETNKHLSILGLAYDSGFNSKSVFNDYFKKAVGQTPKGWLKNQ